MSAYSIQPGEVIVLREETAYDHRKSKSNLHRGELLLTTKAIVFSKKSLFGKNIDCEVFSLKNIQMFDDNPQAKVYSAFGYYDLEVYMTNGDILKFGIGVGSSKNSAIEWVNAIYKVITGHEYMEYDKSSYAIPGVQMLADYASGTVDVLKKSLGLKGQAPEFGFKRQKPEMVVKYCHNCGAQLKGRSGEVVKCAYCGSNQKLS